MTIKTFDHSDEGVAYLYAQERPLTIQRPCPCGCDNRDAPDMVGYIHAITDGKGFTIQIDDEDTYTHIATILKGQLNS